MNKCSCGCGNYVTKNSNIYIHGHNHKGKTYSEIYGNLAEDKKYKRKVAIIGTKREDMIGEKNVAKRVNVRKKIQDGVRKSWEGANDRKEKLRDPEFKYKIRKKLQEIGIWIKDEYIDDFSLYKRKVTSFTNESIKEKYSKEDLITRGRGISGNHIDHIFSVKRGFELGILPSIIGSKFNIRLLSCYRNSIKHDKCDISIEELFEKYNEGYKW